MLYDNFAMLTKRELLIRIVKLLKEKNLVEGVKYIPVEMRPRTNTPIKCCVHKDRYILKHKIISILMSAQAGKRGNGKTIRNILHGNR